MKKILLLSVGLLMCAAVFGQAKKPTLMVVPSDVWCTKNSFMTQYDNMGAQELVPNYKLAMQTSSELMNVISKINILMADRGFPLTDLSTTLRNVERTAALNRALQSSTSGAQIAENPVDQLKRQAKSDIILEVDWTVNETGPKRSVTYNLRGLDAYTGKQVAGAQGTGAASFTAEVPVLLEEAVLANMDNFTNQLQSHFEEMFANGREVSVVVQVFDNGSGLNLESEYGGSELAEIIDNWMAENTVQHRYGKSDASENYMLFDQVRIPLYRDNGMPMDTEYFVRDLAKFLRAAPYNIQSKILPRGLGECMLILGEK